MTTLLPIAGSTQTTIVLTIIISCYNTRELVADCLRSIYENAPSEPYEIILVDDASMDRTSEMVRAEYPDVVILRNDVNRHYGYSNNRALDQARGQFVLLLNNDTIVLPRTLDEMVRFLREHPDAGTVGCRLLNEDGSIQWSVKSLPNPGAAISGSRSYLARLFPGNRFSRKHLLHLDRDMKEPFVAGYLSSAASMMPLAVMKTVGHLDPQFAYHIDADYCKRITEAGFNNYYLPTVAIIHLNHKGGTMASLPVRFRSLFMFELHSFRYYRKHLQKSAASPMTPIVIAGLTFHFLVLAAAQTGSEIAAMLRPRRTEHSPTSPKRDGSRDSDLAVALTQMRRRWRYRAQAARAPTSTDGNLTVRTMASPTASQE